MNYLVYARTSTESQKDNTSAYQQEQDCRAFGERLGWQYVTTVYDNATGTNIERAGVQQVEELLKRGKAKIVMFSKVNRVARGSKAFEEFFEKIYLAGGKIAVVELNTVYDSLAGTLKGTVLHRAIAEFDHLDITEKTEKGKLRVIERNGWMHRPIYGYRLIPTVADGLKVKMPQVVPDQAHIVRFIASEMIAEGNASAIVRKLNDMNVVTRTMKNQWHLHAIRGILNNIELYAGKPFQKEYQVAGTTYILHYRYPSILDSDTALAAERIYRLTKYKRSTNAPATPLKGSLFCGHCGQHGTLQNRRSLKKTGITSFSMACASYPRMLSYKVKNRKIDFDYCNRTVTSSKLRTAILRFLKDDADEATFKASLRRQIRDYLSRYGMIAHKVEDLSELLEKKLEEKRDTQKMLQMTIGEMNVEKLRNVAEAFEQKLGEIEREIGYRSEELTEAEEMKQRMGYALHRLGVQPEQLNRSYADGDFRPCDLTFICDGEPVPNYCRFRNIKQCSLNNEVEKVVVEKADALYTKVQGLADALKAEDWKTVNPLIVDLGLKVTVDFSEPDMLKREQSIKVFFDYDVLEDAVNLVSDANDETPFLEMEEKLIERSLPWHRRLHQRRLGRPALP